MHSDFNVAVHAMVYLKHKDKWIRSDELAENICTNASRVRKVLSLLKKSDLIKTKEGLDGGYAYSKEKGDVTLLEIFKAMNTKVVEVNWKSGSQNVDCLISQGMSGEMEKIYSRMESACEKILGDIRIGEIEKELFNLK